MKEYHEELITSKDENRICVSTKSKTKQIRLSLDMGVEGYYSDMCVQTTNRLIELLEESRKSNDFRACFDTDDLEYRVSIQRINDQTTLGMDICIDGLWVDLTSKEITTLVSNNLQ